MRAVCPLSEDYAEPLRNRKAKNQANKPKQPIAMFTSDTYGNFVRVLETLLKVEREFQQIRAASMERPMFDPMEAFNTISNN